MLHLELVVPGTPVSHQSKPKKNLRAWKKKIRAEAAKVWTRPPLEGKLKFVLYNFHEGDKPSLDIDNMVKPFHDALNKLVYNDDRQICRSEISHVPIDDPFWARGASAILLAALSKGDEFLYVRIEDAPAVHQLPG